MGIEGRWRVSISRGGPAALKLAARGGPGLSIRLGLLIAGKGYDAVGELRSEDGPPKGVMGPTGVPGSDVETGGPEGKDRSAAKVLGVDPGVETGAADSPGPDG